MAIISYEFTIQHFPFFSQCISTITFPQKAKKKNRYELLRISTTVGKILNQMNFSYHVAFIIWRGPSYRVTLQTPPTQSTVIISVSVTVL